MVLKLAANDGCSVGSTSCVVLKLWIRFWKDEQCENPRVCPPDRATRSAIERPRCEKLCWSCEMLKVGAGSCRVSVAFDTLPSFLPFCTSQLGPPDCIVEMLL